MNLYSMSGQSRINSITTIIVNIPAAELIGERKTNMIPPIENARRYQVAHDLVKLNKLRIKDSMTRYSRIKIIGSKPRR